LMDPLMLDMMIIVVVVAKEFLTKVGVLEGMLMSRVTATSGYEDMELVQGVRVGVKEAD
jgi:hypothetical protein